MGKYGENPEGPYSSRSWLTWWAYCLYAVAIVVILYFVFRFLRYKMRMQHEIQIGKMEKQKIQEINHLKLQFFTNITHELMTPLSIILASLENLKSGETNAHCTR